MKSLLCAFAILMLLLFSNAAQTMQTPTPVVSVPSSDRSGTVRVPSPRGRYVLIGTTVRTDLPTARCPSCYSLVAKLWLEDSLSHTRKLLLAPGSSASAGWSPDGGAFFIDDREASDEEFAYLYQTASLKKMNLDDEILAADPRAKRFLEGHFYFKVNRWLSNGAVEVSLSGHTDDAPVQCFLLRYRVSQSGTVRKLSQDERPVDRTFCSWMDGGPTRKKR